MNDSILAYLRVEGVEEAVVVQLEVGRADLERPPPLGERRRGRFGVRRRLGRGGAVADLRLGGGGGPLLELSALCLLTGRNLNI